jgi:class 3 adenylate cyclase/tetratricopeptide (TPR) repeat protein
VLVCASCGAENREGARFCDSCGAVLAEPAAARETRKVVTVLFCDVTGSTALGERIDPESLRRVMARYFETAKAIVERHGGTVEKFIGDAVMAVFGVPAVHEDDALRAVRAAAELRGGLGELNEELDSGYGTRLELRMGVNTGEVVTGTEERLATGDAVNVAARLEQAAHPGEVLLGEETYRLVRDGIEAEPVTPVEAKGKSEPLTAYRLVSVQAEAPGRRHGARMIGRERQRKLLEGAFANVVSDRSCHLFTILGAAGVGKSRLAQEFLSSVDGTVVLGRCLSYGEGISYWPVTEVVKQLVPAGEAVGPLASILGDDSAAGSPEEIAWAFRKLLEAQAADRPVVVVFDDLHWGEPTFLDLVEHVADLSRDAPILLLCMARPELLDVRPAWGGGKLNATTVLLEPLGPDETAELLVALGGGIGGELQERILEAAGGNPLFVEEMVVVAEEGGDEVAVPPTIHALLAARLDQLEPGERGVLERGAVEGQVFHRGAVLALDPNDSPVDGRLVTLVRKDLVRPEQPVVPDDDAYRFRHLLIRDTAYEALPKAKRAELHERFAGWLEQYGSGLVELDEILGYHLEQAYRYRAELGPLDAAAGALAERAAAHLLASAVHAQERGDQTASVGLLTRASELLPSEHPDRPRVQLELATALFEVGEFDRGAAALARAEATATAAGDRAVAVRSQLARIELLLQRDRTATMAEALAAARAALAELEEIGDDEGAVWALRLVGNMTEWMGASGEAEVYWRQALDRAGSARTRQADEVFGWMLLAAWWGPRPISEALRLCDEVLAGAPSKRLEAQTLIIRGAARAVVGELEEGRRDIATGRALILDLGHLISWAGLSAIEAEMELVAGDAARAYEVAAEGREALRASAETGYLTTVVGYLAQVALALGRDDETMRLADETRELAAADDFEPIAREQFVRAQVLARRGDFGGADELIASAAELVDPTDWLMLKRELACARAEVARLAGRPGEQREALEQALSLAEAKGNVVAAARDRETLAELDS